MLKIVSANIDDVGNNETLHELDIRMNHMNVDIICIQETHNTKQKTAKQNTIDPYRRQLKKINGGENEKVTGGIAILIKRLGRKYRKDNKILTSMYENNHAGRNRK